MIYKNVLNSVKQLLSMEVKLAQQTLMDGVTTIEAEEFTPDYSVGIVTPDGVVPMPVGEYTLANGDVMVVEVEGVIKSIAPAATEEAMPEAAHPAAEATEPVMAESTPKKVVESVSKETFFAEIEKIKTELMTQIETLKSENESLKVELASNIPAATPITHNPENIVSKETFQISANRERTTEDVVFSKLFKN
jgi:hypothetical protein